MKKKYTLIDFFFISCRKLQLVILSLRYQYFQMYKKVRGINDLVIHYYSVCWNEEKILPFVFSHYDDIVDHYYVWDNGSTDNTLSILKANPKVTICNFETENKFDDLKHLIIKNNEWKKSRGKADWVIVCDTDEFLYGEKHLKQILKDTKKTIFKPEGYDMITDIFPRNTKTIVTQVSRGIKDPYYNKLVLFNPYKIVDINYSPGCHSANPTGLVLFSDFELKLLHYKRLGLDYLLQRNHILNSRFKEENRQKGMGVQYGYTDASVTSKFYQDLEKSKQVF